MMMRTVMTLFVSVLTIFAPTSIAWAQEEEEEEGIVYYDPTAPEGEQMKRTVEYMELSEDLIEDNNVLEDGKWYYVDDYVWIENRITVNGTVNIILGDKSTLTAVQGIEVREHQTLNIYAQSAGDDCGSLVASIGEGDDSHNGRDAAIGGHGENDDQFYGYYGQSAGTINIFGGNIEVYGDMGGGDGGTCLFDDDAEEFFRRGGGRGGNVDNISIYGGYVHVYGNMGGGNGANGKKETDGGNGGDSGHINIYGGYVCVDGSIGGGYGGESEEGDDGKNGGGDITLSWTDPDSDRIFIHSFNNSIVTFQKEFVNEKDEDVMYEGWYWWDGIEDGIAFIPLNIPRYTITLAGSYNPPCLEFDHNQAREDEEIELLVVNGYNVTSVSVKTEDGVNVEVHEEDYEDDKVWTFNMPAQNVIVSAVATREKFFIRWDQNEGIDIDEADWDNLYTPGSTISFTIDMEEYLQVQSARYCYTDDEGYHEVNCTKDANGSYSFIMPAHDVTIKAPRQQIAYKINYNKDNMQVISNLDIIEIDWDEVFYKTGAEITVSNIKIPDGTVLKNLEITQADNTPISYTDNGNGSYTFLMPSAEVSLRVVYVLDQIDGMTLLVGPTAFTVTKGVIWGVEGSDYFEEYTIGNEDENEGPTYLLDGKYTENNDSKWCLDFGDENKDHPCYVEFHTAKPVVPKKYVLITGNDNSDFNGRNPRDWKIKAKNEGDESWTVIAEVNNDEILKDVNFTPYTFDFNNASNKAYQYFRFEISAIADEEAEVMQLEEMMMWVKDNAASGITTGIENMEHSPSATDQYYDLQGRRVAHPTKGLYIVNGRKVVVE